MIYLARVSASLNVFCLILVWGEMLDKLETVWLFQKISYLWLCGQLLHGLQEVLNIGAQPVHPQSEGVEWKISWARHSVVCTKYGYTVYPHIWGLEEDKCECCSGRASRIDLEKGLLSGCPKTMNNIRLFVHRISELEKSDESLSQFSRFYLTQNYSISKQKRTAGGAYRGV